MLFGAVAAASVVGADASELTVCGDAAHYSSHCGTASTNHNGIARLHIQLDVTRFTTGITLYIHTNQVRPR